MASNLMKTGWMLMLLLGIYRVIASGLMVQMGYGDLSSGVALATTGIAIIGITLGAYKKGAVWSWWTLLLVGALPLVTCTLLNGLELFTIIGWILFLLAILLPVKAVFHQK